MEVLPKMRVREAPVLGLVAVSTAAALWAVGAAVASSLFEDGVTPLELSQARAYITAAGLALLPTAWQKRKADGKRSSWVLLAAMGLAIALVNLTYYVAIDRIPVAVAIVLQYSAPAMVVGWTAFRNRKRPPTPVVLALAGALLGIVLLSEVLSGNLGRLDALGIAMGLGAAITFAAYTLLSESVNARYGPVQAIFRGFAIASLFWLAIQLPREWPAALFEPDNVARVLFVGVAGTLLPFLLYVWGVGRMQAARASIAATLEPVLAATIAWVWLDQTLSLIQFVGGAFVIVAVVSLQNRTSVGPLPPDV